MGCGVSWASEASLPGGGGGRSRAGGAESAAGRLLVVPEGDSDCRSVAVYNIAK